MGGPGSGNWYRSNSRSTVEGCRAIDVRRWKRDGLLTLGSSFATSWSRDGETIASIRVRVGQDDVTLIYRWRQYGDDWTDIEQRVPLSWKSCHLGPESLRPAPSVRQKSGYPHNYNVFKADNYRGLR
jgi:hypothetical protein